MMGNGMQPQNMMMNSSMQRPQSGNQLQQIHAKIVSVLPIARMPSPLANLLADGNRTPEVARGTSRLATDLRYRAAYQSHHAAVSPCLISLSALHSPYTDLTSRHRVSGLRMLHQETMKCISIAESFEERTLHESANKEIYMDKMSKKMAEITQKREQAARNLQANQFGMPMNNNNMGMPPNVMGNLNNMQNGGMGGMNMNMSNMGMGMGMNLNTNMGNNSMGMGMPNGGQQNFPAQLQRQMQPSPIPPQRNQQPPNNTLDPAALQNPQMPQQMPQQQMPNMNQNMSQQTPRQQQPPSMSMNMNGQAAIPGGVPSGPEIIAHAQRQYDSIPEERKTQMRSSLMATMNDQQKANASKDGDPLFKFMISKAKEALIKQRQVRLSQGAAQTGVGMQMGNNNANVVQQTPVSQAGAPNFDFANIMGQQANAIKLQESGEQVVPASNNTSMGLNGQVNMSQGVNPQQLLANQNNQGGPNAQQMQYLAMQQRMQQEKQRQINMQNQMAQQQSMAQQQQAQNQLRGQPGGLNAPNALNGGQVNSPSMNMNMLNRPMAPPGQAAPSTPQPNRPQNMPQTPANPASQLAQHYQSMVNQNNVQMNQGGQGLTPQQQQVLISRLPQEVKEKLAKVPAEQLSTILQRMRDNPQQFGPMLAGLQGGVSMPQQNMQMGNQQSMMSGMPPNMSNAVPAFNSQPPQNQDQAHQGTNDQAGFITKAQTAQQMIMRQRAMDLKEFPKPVLHNLGIQVPPEVRNWGELRQHIQRNQAVLPPDLLQKLGIHQQQWYNAHPEEVKAAMLAFQQLMRNVSQQKAQAQQQQQQQLQQAPPSSRPQSAAPAPNGQAPPAQMVAPSAPMQQQPNPNLSFMNLNQLQIRNPGPDDIQNFRQNVPNSGNMSDDQIRATMMRRMQQHRAQQQQQLQQAQMQRAQALANGQLTGALQAAPQQQPQRPAQQQQAPNQQMNVQGQKRQQSGSDDVMEIPNPNQPQMHMSQPAATQPNQQGQPQMPAGMPSREQMAKMDQQQRLLFIQKMKQMDALRKAQYVHQGATAQQQQQPQPQQASTLPQQQSATSGQQQQPTGMPGVSAEEFKQVENRIKQLWLEVQKATPKGPPMQLDSQGIELVTTSLRKLWPAVMNLDRTFYPALLAPHIGEARVREAMKAKITVQQNAIDDKGTVREYISVSPQDIKKQEVFIGQYFTALKEIKARQDAVRAQAQAASGVTQAQQAPAQKVTQAAKPPQPQAPAPPERKASQQSHARKASAANKAPPAPTENKTFDWGAQSPHGVPKYEPTRSELTADKLKLPPQKKRRTAQQADSQEPTPPAQTTTPQAAGSSPNVAGVKSQTAEQAKKLQAQPKVEAPRFKCDDSMCEASIRGFETEEMLRQHKETEHKPVEDPFKLLEDALSTAEKSLKAEKPAVAPKAPAQPRGKPVLSGKSALKKDGLTPDIKTENGAQRPGSVGKGAAKSTVTPAGKKGADTKRPDSAVDVPEKEKTLLESMANKIAFDLPAPEPTQPDAPIDPTQDIFEDLLMGVQTADGHTFLDDWTDLQDFSNVTDWGLRPEPESSPSLTPSEGTQSSRASDISQTERLRINLEWDAFGNGDTGVPEVLLQTLGLGEDAVMVDAGAGKKDDDEKKADDPLDWHSDLMNWDSMFGANAGLLEGDGMEFGEGDFVF